MTEAGAERLRMGAGPPRNVLIPSCRGRGWAGSIPAGRARLGCGHPHSDPAPASDMCTMCRYAMTPPGFLADHPPGRRDARESLGPIPEADLRTIPIRRRTSACAVALVLAGALSAPHRPDRTTPPDRPATPPLTSLAGDAAIRWQRQAEVKAAAERASRISPARVPVAMSTRLEASRPASPVLATHTNATAKRAKTRPPARRAPARVRTVRTPAQNVPQTGGSVDTVVQYAIAQAGKPYRWASSGPASFDCSGLALSAYARIGVRLPHQSGAQMRYGRPVSRAELRAGDLIFWSGHVAVSLGGNRLVHAANTRVGVVVGTIYGSPIGYRRLVG